MLSRYPLLLLAALLTACTVQVDSASKTEEVNTGTAAQQAQIRAAAKAVATMYDEGQFIESWDLVGPILEAQTNREQWAHHVAVLRKPLGAADRRITEGFNFPNELEDAPPGQYGIIGVRTDFANAKGVEEKFVFQYVSGKWQLVGYWLSKTIAIGS